MGGQKITFLKGPSEGGDLPDSPINDKPDDAVPFVVLSIAGETFAVDISRVREIIRVPHVTWVPGAPEYVRGVINLRGSVVAVLDLAEMLGMAQVEQDSQTRIIVVESTGVVVGMMVDSVSQVVDISPSQLEPALRTLDESQRAFVVAQMNVDQNLIGILELDEILNRSRATGTVNQTG
ncbi:MAG: chemotaxis protein CheW [Thermoleophilia bacterium]|nr:chemotaxis protein CheW [Thermoleophilia bacterium]